MTKHELQGQDGCEESVLSLDSDDLKEVLSHRADTRSAAAQVWSDTQNELDPLGPMTTAQLVHQATVIDKITPAIMAVFDDEWDDLVLKYRRMCQNKDLVPIELPLKRDYCGSDSEGSDNEGAGAEHELGDTVGANGEGSDNEDRTVAFRQSPRTNCTKRQRVGNRVNFEDSD